MSCQTTQQVTRMKSLIFLPRCSKATTVNPGVYDQLISSLQIDYKSDHDQCRNGSVGKEKFATPVVSEDTSSEKGMQGSSNTQIQSLQQTATELDDGTWTYYLADITKKSPCPE
eukprot:gene16896-5205_t